MLNTRQLNIAKFNDVGLVSANTLAKSTVNIIGAANTLAKSTVSVISPANILAKSTVNLTNDVNILAKSTVSVISPVNALLFSTLRIESSKIPSLYIFSAAEALQTVLVNQGSACPFYNPYHDEKINLENTFTFEIPADHPDAQYVIVGSFVAFQDLDLNWQVFDVKRIIDLDDTATTKQVYCDHAYYELLGDIVPSGGGNATSAWIAVTSALSKSRWEVGNVVDLGTQTTVFSYQTALACLQQVATTWKGELQFRIIIVNGAITHRYVDLVARRGTSTGKQFVFGKDLEHVEREVDFNSLYTAMYGRGKATTSGNRLNFASINGGLEYVADATALAQYGLAGGTRHRFGIFDDSQEADPAALLTKTTTALQIAKVPIVNYQFQIISLEQLSSDYAHEAVRIGDTCTALDDNFVPDLQLGVRVIEIKRNLLEYDKTQITLGNFRPDIANTQMFQNQINAKIQNNAGIWDNGSALVPSVLGGAVFDLTSQLRAAGGYVVFDPTNGMMIYDTADPAVATKAMKLGAGIFAIASSKTSGAWNWTTFGSGTGFTADLITAGHISADKVTIGTGASVLGSSAFYWDTSGLYAVDTTNINNVVRITSQGLSIGTAGVGGAFSTAITAAGVVAEKITAGTITGVTISAGTISGGTINGAYISGGTIVGSIIETSTNNYIYLAGQSLKAYNGITQCLELSFIPDVSTNQAYLKFNTFSGGILYAAVMTASGVIASNISEFFNSIVVSGNVTANYLYGSLAGNYVSGTVANATSAIGVDALGANAVLKSSAGNYALLNSSYMQVVLGGAIKHQFNADGTKVGGTIEIDGKNWGMSPVDSPRILISDLILDQEITPEGTVVVLDDKLSQAINGYAVFPSRDDVSISDKQPGSFQVSGTGRVDLYIIGKRVDQESVYWVEMPTPEM